MYIGHKKTKNKYQLYLCHNKRINGQPKKLINQYLFSIDKEELIYENEEQKEEILKDIFQELHKKILIKAKKIPQNTRDELKGDFNIIKIWQLFLNKIKKLQDIENKNKV